MFQQFHSRDFFTCTIHKRGLLFFLLLQKKLINRIFQDLIIYQQLWSFCLVVISLLSIGPGHPHPLHHQKAMYHSWSELLSRSGHTVHGYQVHQYLKDKILNDNVFSYEILKSTFNVKRVCICLYERVN